MLRGRRARLAVVTAGVALVVGAGAGIAATGTAGDGFLADVAGRLGITEQKLANAIRDARVAQIDEAVEAGGLTKEQGERLKERVRSGEALGPGPGERGFHRHGPFGGAGRGVAVLDAAAEYLDVTPAELREALSDEETLADVARAKGKSVDGLEAAIRNALQRRLDDAVEDGRLTEAQAQRMAENLQEHVERIVEKGFRGPRFHRHGPGGSFGPNASFERAAPGGSAF